MRKLLRCAIVLFCCAAAAALAGLIFVLDPEVEPAAPAVATPGFSEVVWPERGWASLSFSNGASPELASRFPQQVATAWGDVMTFGGQADGSEEILVMGGYRSPDVGNDPSRVICSFDSQGFSKSAGFIPYSGTETIVLRNPEGERIELHTGPFRSTFFSVVPTACEKPKGTITYLTSILCLSAPEEKMLKSFRDLGWNTVAALPSDSLYRFWWPLAPTTDAPGGEESAFLARQIDRHYAEQAHATRTAFTYLSEKRPTFREGKQVLIGASAGTFTQPAVARLAGPWDATIFIAGGDSLLEAMAEGSLGILPGLGQFADKPPGKIQKHLSEVGRSFFPLDRYEELLREAATFSTLSPQKLAPTLTGIPVLMIAASHESILPAEQPGRLYEALGRPERWTYRASHSSLFYILPSQVNRIDRRIEQATDSP